MQTVFGRDLALGGLQVMKVRADLITNESARAPDHVPRLARQASASFARQASAKLVQKLRAATRAASEAVAADGVRRGNISSVDTDRVDRHRNSDSGRASQRHSSTNRPKKKGAVNGRTSGRASARQKNKLPALETTERRSERSSLGACAPLPAMTGTSNADAEALPEAESLPELTEAEALQAEAEAHAAAVESKRSAFWAAQEQRKCWSVPLARNLSEMPWLRPHESGLDAAIATAHSLGRTPLLVDSGGGTAAYLARRKAVHLDVKKMVADERLGARSHALVMKEARKALVLAMKTGRALHIALAGSTADFVTHYSGDDTLPLSIFDQRVVGSLADFTGDGAADLGQALDHPFSRVLRPNDLELNGHFHVADGFEVIVSTQLDESTFAGRLALSIPLPKMQPIAPLSW